MGQIVKKKYKIFICYGIILLAFLAFIVLLIKKPQAIVYHNVYAEDTSFSQEEVTFPLKEVVTVDIDNIQSLSLTIGDNTINNYSYQVSITDLDGNVYFVQDYDKYSSSSYYFPLNELKDLKENMLILEIDCADCKGIKANLGKATDKAYISGIEKTLQISINNFKTNKQYYWYVFMLLAVGFTLLPLARSEEI